MTDRASEQPILQRATGKARISFKYNQSRTCLDDLYQQGSAKVKFPRQAHCEAVLINTTGGLTDGDEFATELHWQKGTSALVTTQAAERIYKSRSAPASINTTLTVAANARACWFPQETILFNGSRLVRATQVELQASARLFAIESLVFGRTAMNETVTSGGIEDRWRVHSEGRLIYADNFRLEGNLQAQLNRPGIGSGAIATSTALLVGYDPGTADAVRQQIELNKDVSGGISDLGALLVVRLLADNGSALRKAVMELFKTVESPDLPRVWLC